MIDMLRVMYSCQLCGIKDSPVLVRWREPGESVTDFMEKTVIYQVALQHQRTTPGCPATTLTELKIPIPAGTEGIGERPVT